MKFKELLRDITGSSDKSGTGRDKGKGRANTFEVGAASGSSRASSRVLQGYCLSGKDNCTSGKDFKTERNALIFGDPNVAFYVPWDRPTKVIEMTPKNTTLASRDGDDFTVTADGYKVRVHESTKDEVKASVKSGILSTGHITQRELSKWDYWAPKTFDFLEEP